jgi:hypothetical protein
MDPRVNKWLDLLDRAGWTAIQAAGGAIIAWLATDEVGWEAALIFVGSATLIAVAKVIVGQRVNDGTGSLIGQPVITESPTPPTPAPPTPTAATLTKQQVRTDPAEPKPVEPAPAKVEPKPVAVKPAPVEDKPEPVKREESAKAKSYPAKKKEGGKT